MLILQGILRQAGELTLGKDKPEPFLKLWIEHETPRQNGPADLAISELLIPKAEAPYVPAKGEIVNVAVRAYASGRDVAFSALSLLPQVKPATAAK